MSSDMIQQCFVLVTEGRHPELDIIAIGLDMLRSQMPDAQRRIVNYWADWLEADDE